MNEYLNIIEEMTIVWSNVFLKEDKNILDYSKFLLIERKLNTVYCGTLYINIPLTNIIYRMSKY